MAAATRMAELSDTSGEERERGVLPMLLDGTDADGCCKPNELGSCCEPSDKAECCGPDTSAIAAPKRCGCQR